MTLVVRRHTDGDRESEAVYSACDQYRYSLTRMWQPEGQRLLYLMLNPSKATELANDPTIERCERRAKALGYGAFRVCNLFAFRETDPARLKRARAPVGPDNMRQISEALPWADAALCAWGVHGAHRNQADAVLPVIISSKTPLLTLGLTKDGHPRHPLYIGYGVKPTTWSPQMKAQSGV